MEKISLSSFILLIISLFSSINLFSQTFLYGVTTEGGSSGGGTIYRIKPDGTSYSIVYNFEGNISGINPLYTELVEYNSKLYGMTQLGGLGILFEFDPSTGIYSKKISFGVGSGSGVYPSGSLTLFNGKLYGMTFRGGNSDQGTLFEYNPVNNTILYRVHFLGVNGANPNGNLTVFNNKLYGMTSEGGVYAGSLGTLFEYVYIPAKVSHRFLPK